MASQKYNILYGRLSQEDERQGESNSIHNQKLFLEKYAADNGFENTLFLADDGYSGTNFERPAWKKIVEMIENSEVETLIVKDLSRLGREYLQVGQLTSQRRASGSSRSTTVWTPWWRAATTSTPSETGPMSSTPRTPAKRCGPSRRCRRSAGSVLAPNHPTGTRRRIRIPKRSYQMRRLPLWYAGYPSCAPLGKGPTRSPES